MFSRLDLQSIYSYNQVATHRAVCADVHESTHNESEWYYNKSDRVYVSVAVKRLTKDVGMVTKKYEPKQRVAES
jgi:hypothetical protein